jgi:type II secretory ATPase GspE/PulE/Tfp pilus assembly ATPase PilB-like protein
MPWAIQLSCRSEEFPQMVRYSLRMDPNAILLGEVRGVDEALAALQAAMTGHLVLTTLHVTDPFETFSRLELLDNVRLSRQVVCNHKQVIGLISQRRVPILCSNCSQAAAGEFEKYPGYLQRALKSWAGARPYGLEKVKVRGKGCPECNYLGIIREQAVAEVVVTDEQLMVDCIQEGVLIAGRRHRKRPGSDKSMIEHAMDLVLEGLLDPSDAEHEVDEIPIWEGTDG